MDNQFNFQNHVDCVSKTGRQRLAPEWRLDPLQSISLLFSFIVPSVVCVPTVPTVPTVKDKFPLDVQFDGH